MNDQDLTDYFKDMGKRGGKAGTGAAKTRSLEHYRRIAYSNEKFTSGDQGWRTDRGRIYIIHGPPATVVSRPDCGAYVRKIEEGGGVTSVHPFEVWRYHFIEGIGNDVELEFVD